MDKENLIEQAKSLAAAMFDPLGNGESDNMVMSNQDAQNAAEIIYGLVALLEDDNPPWTAKDFATAVPFREIVKMHLAEQQTEREQDAKRNVVGLADQTEQKPVAWMNEVNGFICKEKTRNYQVPLYAAPVRTKDLTDDELQPFLDEWWNLPCDTAHDVKKIFRAVIATDREKNK